MFNDDWVMIYILIVLAFLLYCNVENINILAEHIKQCDTHKVEANV